MCSDWHHFSCFLRLSPSLTHSHVVFGQVGQLAGSTSTSVKSLSSSVVHEASARTAADLTLDGKVCMYV
jgi:hypothetical protein